MKKILFLIALISVVFVFAGCKSTAKATSEEKSANEAAAGDEVAAQSLASKDSEPEDAIGSVGWIKGAKKNIDDTFGNIRLRIKAKYGSYSIGAVNEKGKTVSALATMNEYTTNAFYLKTSRKIFNLVTDANVTATAKRKTAGASILYDIPDVAQVNVDFYCFSSEKKKNNDMVKVTATIKNMSHRNDEFAFKAIFDTILGEGDLFHFYTWENVPVKNEVMYRTLQNQKWFVSKNGNAAMQLFFSGADCTEPELVALANYSTLERNTWEPDMLSYRAFDTVLSYNNSAVCSIWKSRTLAPSESATFVFYLAVAGDGALPQGEKYVYSKEFEEKTVSDTKKTVEYIKDQTGTSQSSPEVVSGEESVKEIKEFEGVEDVEDVEEVKTEVPSVDFYVKNMSKEQLTPEYIQSLLDRIAELEEDSSSLNRQELLELNAELDAILTYLRQ